jgi:hypothetical protein
MEAEFEINTLLMNATFKIKQRGSRGTAFFMGIPAGPRRDRLEYVLITAAHILEQMKGDQATLFLRGRIPDQYVKLLLVMPIRKGEKPLWARNPSVNIAAMSHACGIHNLFRPYRLPNAYKSYHPFRIHRRFFPDSL